MRRESGRACVRRVLWLLGVGMLCLCWTVSNARAQDTDAPAGGTPSGADRLRAAYALLRERKLDEAEQAFRTLIAENPKEIGAFAGLAECLSGKGRHEEAVAEYRKAVALNPSSGAVRADLRSCSSVGKTSGPRQRRWRSR